MTSSVFERLDETMGQGSSYDSNAANIVHLVNCNGMTASFMDIGATWLSCSVPVKGEQREVLLRSKNMKEHMRQTAFLGAVVGRFANRIKLSSFEMSGQIFNITSNEGKHSLHGGCSGFDKRRWVIEKQSKQDVVFSLVSPDGDQGYPGQLMASVHYCLKDDNCLDIFYQADIEKEGPVNLTNHAYFNLDRDDFPQNCLEHSMQMKAPYYLPITEDMLPTGEFKSTQSTVFDFSIEKKIGDHFLEEDDQITASGFDHAFILDKKVTDGKQDAIKLISSNRDLEMIVKTTKPAVQVYTGNFLHGVVGPNGPYSNHAGIALETQYLPDGPNHPEWQGMNGLFLSGSKYSHQTSYQFVAE